MSAIRYSQRSHWSCPNLECVIGLQFPDSALRILA